MSTLEFCLLRNAPYSFMAFLYELIPSYTFPFICRPGGSGRFVLSSSFEYVRRYPIISRLTFTRSIPKAVSIPLHRVMASATESFSFCSPKRCNSQFSKPLRSLFSHFCFHRKWDSTHTAYSKYRMTNRVPFQNTRKVKARKTAALQYIRTRTNSSWAS